MMIGGYLLEMDIRSEQILLAQARDGDEQSFARLVEANSAAVYRHALRMLGNEADAEDAAQETFVRFHRSIARFRGEARIATWLYRTVSRLAIDHMRREKIKQALFFTSTQQDSEDPVSKVADLQPSAQQTLLAKEQQSQLIQALQTLSPRQRAIFSLRHFEERSLKEVAEILDLELGTVKAHLHRAVSKLREIMQGERL